MSFEYRNIDGADPRVCLLEDGPEKCALLPALNPSAGWHRVDQVIVPHPKTTGLRLFFYADGTGEGLTINQYRDVRVSAVPPADPVLLGASPSSIGVPHVTYIRVGSAEVRAQVSGATGPFLLVLTESFAPGWRIEVPGRDAAAVRHVRVDGYANGWLIPWEGTYQVRFIYGPEGIARFARWTGLILVPALVGGLLLGGRRYRGDHERRWPRTRRRIT
jgi:arabinofuranan 3-O-arabinosyltransferase